MILKFSLSAKAGVPTTLLKHRLRLHSLYFPQNTLMLSGSRGKFSDLHFIFRLHAPRYYYYSSPSGAKQQAALQQIESLKLK